MGGKLDLVEDLALERKGAGITQGTLALRAGVDQTRVSRYESGDRAMGRASAEKLARVLDADADTLMFGNRAAMMRKAMRDGDPAGVLEAAKSAVKLADARELTEHGEEALDELAGGLERYQRDRRRVLLL